MQPNLKQVDDKVEQVKTEVTNDHYLVRWMVGDIKYSALQKDHGKWMICKSDAQRRARNMRICLK